MRGDGEIKATCWIGVKLSNSYQKFMLDYVGLAFEQIFDEQLVQRVLVVRCRLAAADGQWCHESAQSVHVRVDCDDLFYLELAVERLKRG